MMAFGYESATWVLSRREGEWRQDPDADTQVADKKRFYLNYKQN